MARPTAETIGQRALDLGLLTERQLDEAWGAVGSRSVDVDSFLQTLVRRELLTNYQIDRLVKGERTGFFYGNYKVLYFVGQGTFARVFRAVHRETGQIVAIKALRNRFSEIPAQYNLFLREGELGRSLRHPNIVPIYEVHSSGNTHFLVMEFVEGRSLREFVKIRKYVSPQEATRLAAEIVGGLDYAFQRAVTHRDLRMSNVLVSSRGQAKLVDFGLATADEALADNTEFEMPSTRTIDYAALERATGVRKDDPRSDIYFAGCIYYNMLTGIPPLMEVKNRMQRLNKSRFTTIPSIQSILPQLPHYLVAALNKSMAFDPNRRYQTPGEFAADLEAISRRLAEEELPEMVPVAPAADAKPVPAASPEPERPQRTIMVVEANVKMQDLFRDGLKKAGYRVLLTSDPERAFERLSLEFGVADCVIVSTGETGEAALAMFNRLAEDVSTQNVPAILLLEEHQRAWKRKASTAPHRIVASFPVTLRQLRGALEKLIPIGEVLRANA